MTGACRLADISAMIPACSCCYVILPEALSPLYDHGWGFYERGYLPALCRRPEAPVYRMRLPPLAAV
jgi:hypothetical protein